MTRCPKLKCAVSPKLILKHLISSVVSLAQLVSPSVALPAEFVWFYNGIWNTFISKWFLKLWNLMRENEGAHFDNFDKLLINQTPLPMWLWIKAKQYENLQNVIFFFAISHISLYWNHEFKMYLLSVINRSMDQNLWQLQNGRWLQGERQPWKWRWAKTKDKFIMIWDNLKNRDNRKIE